MIAPYPSCSAQLPNGHAYRQRELGRSCAVWKAYGGGFQAKSNSASTSFSQPPLTGCGPNGFMVESKAASSRFPRCDAFYRRPQDKHLIFLWSAGEIGLAWFCANLSRLFRLIPENILKTPMLLNGRFPKPRPMLSLFVPVALRHQIFVMGRESQRPPVQLDRAGVHYGDFSPVGSWIGDYTCAQGTTVPRF